MGKRKYNPDYGFLEEYIDKDDLEEYEIEKLLREKKITGQYRTDTITAGDQLALNIYPAFAAWDYRQRAKKKHETSKAQEAVNAVRRKRRLEMLAAENFTRDDYWGTLTFKEDDLPEDYEAAVRSWKNYLACIRRYRKKAGLGPLKYIAVMEYSPSERCHFHVIFSGDMDRDVYEDLWKYGTRNQMRRLDPDEDTHLAGLVNYLSKGKTAKGAKHWFQSKGLRKPKVTTSFTKFRRRTVAYMAMNHADLVQKVSEAHPNYKFVDAEVKVNPFNGGLYLYVRMTRVSKRRGTKKQNTRDTSYRKRPRRDKGGGT